MISEYIPDILSRARGYVIRSEVIMSKHESTDSFSNKWYV